MSEHFLPNKKQSATHFLNSYEKINVPVLFQRLELLTTNADTYLVILNRKHDWDTTTGAYLLVRFQGWTDDQLSRLAQFLGQHDLPCVFDSAEHDSGVFMLADIAFACIVSKLEELEKYGVLEFDQDCSLDNLKKNPNRLVLSYPDHALELGVQTNYNLRKVVTLCKVGLPMQWTSVFHHPGDPHAIANIMGLGWQQLWEESPEHFIELPEWLAVHGTEQHQDMAQDLTVEPEAPSAHPNSEVSYLARANSSPAADAQSRSQRTTPVRGRRSNGAVSRTSPLRSNREDKGVIAMLVKRLEELEVEMKSKNQQLQELQVGFRTLQSELKDRKDQDAPVQSNSDSQNDIFGGLPPLNQQFDEFPRDDQQNGELPSVQHEDGEFLGGQHDGELSLGDQPESSQSFCLL